MFNKVRILIKQSGFQVMGQGSHGDLYIQEWGLSKGQSIKQLSGRLWQDADLATRWIRALEQVVIASARLARNYQEGLYGLVECAVSIGAGYVEAHLNQGQEGALWLRQEWDQHRQLKPLHVLGDFRSVSSSFLEDFREACFGRYGLLARTMEHDREYPKEHGREYEKIRYVASEPMLMSA